MAAYLEKLRHLRLAVNQNGGIVGSFLAIFRTEELKWGSVVGEDKYGNKYYHNKLYAIGRSRWVMFPPSVGYDYDASQVPADWHRWLHYITDETPTDFPQKKRSWMIDHLENTSASSSEYVPYSTTRPKIEAWVPPKPQS